MDMATSTLPVEHNAPASAALRTGVALAVTVAVFYTLCTLAWLAAPGPFLGFMNGLFHGIDFTSLVHPGGFAWGGFFEALLVMSLWALLAGTFFGWLRQLLDA
jgi:hypothetical protein